MHLKQHNFTNNACRRFTKNKERIQKMKKTERAENKYGDFKDLPERTASGEVLHDKGY